MADRTRALTCYAVASLVLIGGALVAAARFPGGFDWAYTVMSALASRKHNPAAVWFSGALALAMILLLPVAGHLGRATGPGGARPRIAVAGLRVGVCCGALLGAERLFIYDLSSAIYKAHELLAVLTFLGLYWGVLGLYLHRIRQSAAFLGPALFIVLPIVAIGISQATLYFSQRDIGWVGAGWREMGIPLWLSFAFWQWLAVALLWIGLGHLIAAGRGVRGSVTRGAQEPEIGGETFPPRLPRWPGWRPSAWGVRAR